VEIKAGYIKNQIIAYPTSMIFAIEQKEPNHWMLDIIKTLIFIGFIILTPLIVGLALWQNETKLKH